MALSYEELQKIEKNWKQGKAKEQEMMSKSNPAPSNGTLPVLTSKREAYTFNKYDTRNMSREEEAAYKKKVREDKQTRKEQADKQNNVARTMGDTRVNRYDSRFMPNVKENYSNSELGKASKTLAQVAYTEEQNKAREQKKVSQQKSEIDELSKNILDNDTLAAYDAQLKMYQSMPALDMQDQKDIDEINERLRMHEEAKEQLARINGENHLVNNQRYNQLMSDGRFANDIDTLTTLLHDNSINYGGSVAAQDKRAKDITGGLTMNQYLTQLSKRYELTEDELRDIALTRNAEQQNEVNAHNMAEYERLGATAYGIPGTLASFAGTVGNTLEAPINLLAGGITDDDRRISRGSNIVKTGLREGAKTNIHNDLGKAAYDIGTGLGDMAVGAALGNAPAVLAANATDSAMLNSLDRGINPRQAAVYATATGLTDYITNKIGLDKAKELAMGSVTESMLEGLSNSESKKAALREITKASLKNNAIAGAGEMGENVIQDIAQSFLDRMINGEDAELNRSYAEKIASGMSETEAFAAVAKEYAAQMGVDAVQGFLMGSVMNAAHARKYNKENRAIISLMDDLTNNSQRVWDKIAEEKAQGITSDNVNNLPELEKITESDVKNQPLAETKSEPETAQTQALQPDAEESVSTEQSFVRQPYNPTQDMGWAEGSRKYKGVIDPDDVAELGEEYGINGDETKFIKNGQWADGTGSYVLADGSHSNMQFRRGRNGVFYVENLDRRPDNYDVKPTNATNTETTEAPTPETTQSSVNPDDFVVQKIRVRGEERYQILKDLHDDAPLERASEFGNLVYKTEKSARRAIQKFIANENAKTEQPNEVASSMPENGITAEDYAAQRQALIDSQEGMSLPEMVNVQNQLRAMDAEMLESHPEWFRDGKFVGEEARYDFSDEMDEPPTNEPPAENTPVEEPVNETPSEEPVEKAEESTVEEPEESKLTQEEQDGIKMNLQFFAELSEEKKKLQVKLTEKGVSLRQRRIINDQIADIDESLLGLRRTITNTAVNAGIVTQEEIDNDPELSSIAKYVKHSNAETNEQARQSLAENGEKIKNDYVSGKSEIKTDLDASRAMMLLRGEYGNLDNFERNGILRNLATHGTEAGQFIQSLAQYSNTKEGALINATKVLQEETEYFIKRHASAQRNNNRIATALRKMGYDGSMNVERQPMSREQLEKSIRETLEKEYGSIEGKFNDDDIRFLADLSEDKSVALWQIVDEIEHKLQHGEFYELTKDAPEPKKPKNGKLLSALNALVEGEIREKPQKTFKQLREEVKNTLDEESASFNSHKKGDIDVEFTDSDIDYIAHMIEHGASIADIEDALNTKLATGRFGISDETQAKINELFESAKNYDENSQEYVERQAEAFRLLAEEVAPRATPMEKFDAWRYMAMLGNPKTMLRNYVGNKVWGTLTGISNNLAAIVEGGVDKASKALGGEGIERTKAVLNPLKDKELLDATLQDAYGKRFRQIEGSKYEKMDKDALRQHRDVFDSRLMRLAEKAVDKGISDTKAVAKKYSTSMAGYMKANGITLEDLQDAYTYDILNRSKDLLSPEEMQVLDDLRDTASKVEKARDYALKQAEYATFHEDNAIAEVLSRASRSSTGMRVLVEGLVPFKKTPANIIRSGVEFSPLGAIKSIAKTGKLIYENTGKRKEDLDSTYEVKNPLTHGKREVNRTLAADVIESWSQTITGSALASLGYYLYSKGILHSSKDDEKYQDDLEGKQNYSIEINGKTYTIDWAVPGAMPLLLGAEVKKAFDENAIQDKKWYENPDRMFNTLNGLFQPIVETSMLQGVQNTFSDLSNSYDNATPFEKAANAATTMATNYLTQAIPTLSGQIARTVDNTRRSTDTKSEGLLLKSLEKQGRKVMNKIPGLSQFNNPYINARGEKEKNAPYDNGLQRLLYQTLSPAYVQEIDERKSDRIAREAYNGLDAQGKPIRDEKVFADWKSSEKLNGEKLTPDQMYKYRKAAGKANTKIRERLADEDWFNELPAKQRSEILHNTNTLVEHIGLNAVDDNYGSESEAYKAYESGGISGVLDYYKKSSFKSQYGAKYNEYAEQMVQTKEGAKLLKELSQYDKQNDWLTELDKQNISKSDKAKVIRAMKGDDIAQKAGTTDQSIYEYYMGKAQKAQEPKTENSNTVKADTSKDNDYDAIKQAGGSDKTYSSFQLYSKKASKSSDIPKLNAKQYMQQVSRIERYNKDGKTNGEVSQQELVDYMRANSTQYDLDTADEYVKAFFGDNYEAYTVTRGDNKGKIALKKIK